MKDEINLLPPHVQQARWRRLFRKRLAYIGRRLILALIVVWAVLGAAVWWLTQEEQAIRQETHREADGVLSAENDVRRVNELMGIINRRVDEHPGWSAQLKDVVRLVPDSARLEAITLSADSKLTLKGLSNSRTAVLDMERSLKELPWLARVEAPLQNFAAGGKGEFSFTLIRKSDEHETE